VPVSLHGEQACTGQVMFRRQRVLVVRQVVVAGVGEQEDGVGGTPVPRARVPALGAVRSGYGSFGATCPSWTRVFLGGLYSVSSSCRSPPHIGNAPSEWPICMGLRLLYRFFTVFSN
jgi:hypothetical protein